MDDTLQLPSDFGVVLPASMEMALIKGMSISPQQRYQDIKVFCDDFYRMTEPGISEQRNKEKAELQEKSAKSKKSFIKIVAAILCIVLGCGGIGIITQQRIKQKKLLKQQYNPQIRPRMYSFLLKVRSLRRLLLWREDKK